MSILFQGLIDKLAPKDDITDAMAQEYYDENPDMFVEQAGKRVSHILFNTEDEALAQEVLAQLQDGTGDFAALATEYSQDAGSAANGGDLGWGSSEQYVTEFKEAVDAMEEGDLSDLVQTEYGWHIITITETREEGKMPFDEVREDIKTMLHGQEQSEIYQHLMDTLRNDAEIEILDPAVIAYRANQEVDPAILDEGLEVIAE